MIAIAKLKAHLGLAVDSTTYDEVLEDYEAAAVAQIESATHRYFGPPEDVTVVVRGSGARNIWLDEAPLASPAVTVGELTGVADEDPEGSAVTGFVVRDRALYRTDGSVWARGYEYVVTMRRGYAVGAEPADVRAEVLRLVGLRWAERGREGLKSETIGGYSYTADTDGEDPGPAVSQAIIARWRDPVMA
jgi:hypothetical protein